MYSMASLNEDKTIFCVVKEQTVPMRRYRKLFFDAIKLLYAHMRSKTVWRKILKVNKYAYDISFIYEGKNEVYTT